MPTKEASDTTNSRKAKLRLARIVTSKTVTATIPAAYHRTQSLFPTIHFGVFDKLARVNQPDAFPILDAHLFGGVWVCSDEVQA